MSKALEFYGFGPGKFDFYRCQKCSKVFTYEEERIRLAEITDEQTARICPCGSRRYTSSFPSELEWLRPNILLYTLKLFLAREAAPWARKWLPWLLPLIERLVSNKLTR